MTFVEISLFLRRFILFGWRYASHVILLARELRRFAQSPLPEVNERFPLEVAIEASYLRLAYSAGARRARSVKRLVRAGQGRVRRARRLLTERERLAREPVLLDRTRTTMDDLRNIAGRRDGNEPCELRPRISWLGRVACGLQSVNVLALAMIASEVLGVDWRDPAPVAMIGVGTLLLSGLVGQPLLTSLFGRQLWAYKALGGDRNHLLSVSVLVSGGLVALMSSFTAGAFYLRSQAESGTVSGAIGLVLGISAFVAPWCAIASLGHSAGSEVRSRYIPFRILARVERRRAKYAKRASRLVEGADRRLTRAGWLERTSLTDMQHAFFVASRVISDARSIAWPESAPSTGNCVYGHEYVRGQVEFGSAEFDDCRITLPISRLRDSLAAVDFDFHGNQV